MVGQPDGFAVTLVALYRNHLSEVIHLSCQESECSKVFCLFAQEVKTVRLDSDVFFQTASLQDAQSSHKSEGA